jgi:hypothetical protein
MPNNLELDLSSAELWLFGDMDWCDQSGSPPTKAGDTHALLFRYRHGDPSEQHNYHGLLFYTPPSVAAYMPSTSLGYFQGTGFSGEAPTPWVRISIGIRRSLHPDDTGVYKVGILANFTFLNADSSLVHGPGDPQYGLDSDVRVESLTVGNDIFVGYSLVVSEGIIYTRRTTVVR